MRRAIAHSLLVTFSLLLIAPLFAPDAEANLPACCRRAGKHHCMMRSLPESTGAVHSVKYIPEAGQRFYAEVLFHPGYVPHTSARSRMSFLRSHQRRGPPSPLA